MRSVDMSAPVAEQEGWEPTEDRMARCEEQEYPVVVSDLEEIRVRVVTDPMDEDRLVQFALVKRVRVGTKWEISEEVDSKHGCIHHHRYSLETGKRTGKRKVLQPLTCCDDVQMGYNNALEAWRA